MKKLLLFVFLFPLLIQAQQPVPIDGSRYTQPTTVGKTAKTGTFANLPVVSYGYRPPRFSTTFSDGVATQEVSRLHHIAIGNISDLHLVYCNFPYIAALTTDANPSSDVTISANIEYPAGTFTNVYFNSNLAYIVKLNQTSLSDPVPIYIPNGADFWIRTSVTVTSGQKWIRNMATNSAFNEGVASNSGTLTGTINNLTTSCFGPAAVVGTSTSNKGAIAWIGDSISNGTGDSGAGVINAAPYSQYGGIYNRAFMQTYPCLMLNVAGQKASFWNPANTSSTAQNFSAILSTCQFAICNLGANDFVVFTAAQMQANYIALWSTLKAKGIITYQGTITPRTSSTDAWATTANQTVTGFEAVRAAINSWLMDGAPYNYVTLSAASVGATGTNIVRMGSPAHALSGVIDFNGYLDPGLTGKWPVNGTADGLHPNSTWYPGLAALVATQISNNVYTKY